MYSRTIVELEARKDVTWGCVMPGYVLHVLDVLA